MIEHDVLIIGGGLAGSRAALAIAQNYPNQSVGLISNPHSARNGRGKIIKKQAQGEDSSVGR
jgi:succinate dehydrogenase/fumarate reductase flavoprotein subunit